MAVNGKESTDYKHISLWYLDISLWRDSGVSTVFVVF